MESERKVKIITLVAVIVAVIGLTIAFAAMSRTLNIHGSGTMDPVNWDIYFENIKLKSDTSPSSVTGNPTPTTGNTAATINNLNVTLKNPGDEVVWTADITNNGDVNAEMQSFSLTPNLTNELLEFTAIYTDEYEHGHVITVGDMLYAGETRNITITFKYKDITDESLLPDEAEEINVSYQIVYVQSNKVSTTTTAAPVATYQVGEKFCLNGQSECFYVLTDNGSTVTALAEWNLDTDNTGIQNSEYRGSKSGMTTKGDIAFGENNNNGYGYWYNTTTEVLDSNYGDDYPAWVFNSNSNLWQPVQNYQTYLRNTLGKASATATLVSYEQAVGVATAYGGFQNLPAWVFNTTYWLGTAYDNSNVWNIHTNGNLYGGFSYSNGCGVRPVITIAKNDL